MSATIVVGKDGHGNCPQCGYVIQSIAYETFGGIYAQPQQARCITGCIIMYPTVVMRWDAPSPIYPLAVSVQ